MVAALSDLSLRKLFEGQNKLVDPIDDDCKNPASIDLRVGNVEIIYQNSAEPIDLIKVNLEETATRQDFEHLDITPGTSKIVSLEASINMPAECMGLVVTRSSFNRLGISVSTTMINPGYSGIMPISISNLCPNTVRISPGIRIAQLIVLGLSEAPEKDYSKIESSKYHQEEASPSRLHLDQDLARIAQQVVQNNLGDTKYI